MFKKRILNYIAQLKLFKMAEYKSPFIDEDYDIRTCKILLIQIKLVHTKLKLTSVCDIFYTN